MASFNRVVLLGNVTRDIQVKFLQSGTAVAEVGLAVNERYKDKSSGEMVDKPVFVDVTLWGRTAEIAGEYLQKGKPVLIEGRLALDQWNDKDSGQKRSKLKVVGETLQLLGNKGDGQGQRQREPDSQAPAPDEYSQAADAFPAGGVGGPGDGDVPF